MTGTSHATLASLATRSSPLIGSMLIRPAGVASVGLHEIVIEMAHKWMDILDGNVHSHHRVRNAVELRSVNVTCENRSDKCAFGCLFDDTANGFERVEYEQWRIVVEIVDTNRQECCRIKFCYRIYAMNLMLISYRPLMDHSLSVPDPLRLCANKSPHIPRNRFDTGTMDSQLHIQ